MYVCMYVCIHMYICIYTYTHINIYISSSSSCRAASTDIPDPPLSTSPYHSSPLAGLQGYIPYHHIAAVCMFKLAVLLLIGHMRGYV